MIESSHPLQRWTRPLVAALLALPGTAPADPATPAADVMPGARCESHKQFGDRLEIACTLPAPESGKRFRFRAHFAGSHDDTTLSMTPTIGGQPVACDEGSRTRLEGEDGDVHLECRFAIAVAAAPVSGPVLKVLLSWHHARYMQFELMAQ